MKWPSACFTIPKLNVQFDMENQSFPIYFYLDDSWIQLLDNF